MILYEDCVLLKDIGDVPKGTKLDSIGFDVYNTGNISFEFNEKEYTCKLDASAVIVS
jgi:hypothetical protein